MQQLLDSTVFRNFSLVSIPMVGMQFASTGSL